MADEEDLPAQAGVRLEEAETLFKASLYEGAVARAYYAAFSAARALLAADSEFSKSQNGVIGEFGRRYVRAKIVDPTLGKVLPQLEAKRNLADYGAGRAIGKADAESAISRATELLEAAVNYMRAP